MRERKAPGIHEIRPLALDDVGARAARELHGMVVGACVEHEEMHAARQTGEGAWQIALFVARENDGGDYAWVQLAASRLVVRPSTRSWCVSAAPMKSR